MHVLKQKATKNYTNIYDLKTYVIIFQIRILIKSNEDVPKDVPIEINLTFAVFLLLHQTQFSELLIPV